MTGTAPKLLAGDTAPEGKLGVEVLEESQGLRAKAITRLAMDVPLSIHRRDGLGPLQLIEELAEPLGPEGHPDTQIGCPQARRSCLPEMLLHHLRGRRGLEEAKMLGERAALALEPRGDHVEHGAAADGDDGRVRPNHVAIAGQRGHGSLEAETPEGYLPRRDLRAVNEKDAGHHLLRSDRKSDVEGDAVGIV